MTDTMLDRLLTDWKLPSPTCFIIRRWDGDGRPYELSEKFYYNAGDPIRCPMLPPRDVSIALAEQTAQSSIRDPAPRKLTNEKANKQWQNN